MEQDAKIYVAGHTGLVGSAFVRALRERGHSNLVLPTRRELDLLRQSDVERFFGEEKPQYVIDASEPECGIQTGSDGQADSYYQNIQTELNLIWSAFRHGVKKFLFLGSTCMYPKGCPQPMKEEMLLGGPLEARDEGYALAKIEGSRLCSYLYRQYGAGFLSAIPADVYGKGEAGHSQSGQAILEWLGACQDAKESGKREVKLRGAGADRRELIYVDDLADAGLFLMEHYAGYEPVNIGTGKEISMLELARLIPSITGWEGSMTVDGATPASETRRVCDSHKLRAMGWKPKIPLEDGLGRVYGWYLAECRGKGRGPDTTAKKSREAGGQNVCQG